MAAQHLSAEREKIQREIDKLERSLGPSDAMIEVVVSESSLDSDSDDDDFELEDDVDAFQMDDGEDDGSEKSLPNSPEMCLQMNLVYQAVIEEKIQEVELLIVQNKEQQEELLWELAGRKMLKSGETKTHPMNVFLGHFSKPYFKDKVTGVGPPANQDKRDKTSQGIKCLEEHAYKQWKRRDQKELKEAVISDSLQRLLQPKLFKLEYLNQKLDNAKEDMDKKIVAKQIGETEREVEDINLLPEHVLFGQRTDEHDWEKISNINFEGVHSAEKLRKVWQNSLHPSIYKKEWSEDEVLKLQSIAAEHHYVHWDVIAQELGTNRTAFQCLQKYQNYNKDFKRREFSKEEDEVLTQFIQEMRVGNHIPYRKIAYFMEGRDSLQLLYRWTKCLDPNLKKGFWSPSEDELLLKAISKYGEKDWYKIRDEVPGRSDSQCRERYLKGLHADVKKGKWSAEEKAKLSELIEKYGVGRWTKIASELTHRTGSQCLSKWKCMIGYKSKLRATRTTAKQIKKEVISESESSSEDTEMELDYSEEEEKAAPKVPRRVCYTMPSLDMWVPRMMATPTHSAASSGKSSSSKGKKKAKPSSFEFNTVLKGIAYPHSTDLVTEDPAEVLREASESGKQMLRIGVEDVRKVLRKNTHLWHEKNKKVQKQPKSSSRSVDQLLSELLVSGQPQPQQQRKLDPYKYSVDRKLLLAVTPWVGNVFLPLSRNFGRTWWRRTEADVLREKLSCVALTSTPVFTLLIQLFQIDAEGCLQMIRQRKSKQSELFRAFTKTLQAGPPTVSPSSKSPIVRSIKAPPQRKNQEPRAIAASQGQKCGNVNQGRPLAPIQKPKTVFELLKEKRMREAKARKAAQNALVLPPNMMVSQPLMIHSLPNATGHQQTMVLPQTQSTPGCLPGSPGQLPRQTSITLMPTVTSQMGNNNSVPITWIVTPHGLVPLPIQTVGFPSPVQKAAGQSTGGVSAPPVASVNGKEVNNMATPLSSEAEGKMADGSDGNSSSAVTKSLASSSEEKEDSSVQAPGSPTGTNSSSSNAMSAVDVSLSPQVAVATDVHSPQLPGDLLPTPGPSSSATNCLDQTNVSKGDSGIRSQSALTPKKYPVVKMARLLIPNYPETVMVKNLQTASRPGQLPPPGSSPKHPVSNNEKNVLDVSLVSLEEEAKVKEWLQGKQGVEVPALRNSMPYMPPSICNLKTLSRLLLQKNVLEQKAFKLVPPIDGEERSSTRKLEILSDVVDQNLQDNPAYLLLKQRFLSAFTFPALLATLPPNRTRTNVVNTVVKCEDSDDDTDESTEEEIGSLATGGKDVGSNVTDTLTVGHPEPSLPDQEVLHENSNVHASSPADSSVSGSRPRRTARKRTCYSKRT